MQSFANETVSSDLRVMPGHGGLVMFLRICGADSRVGGFRLAPVVRIPNPTKTDKDPRPVRMGFLCAQAVVQQPNGHQVQPIRHPSHGPCVHASVPPGNKAPHIASTTPWLPFSARRRPVDSAVTKRRS